MWAFTSGIVTNTPFLPFTPNLGGTPPQKVVPITFSGPKHAILGPRKLAHDLDKPFWPGQVNDMGGGGCFSLDSGFLLTAVFVGLFPRSPDGYLHRKETAHPGLQKAENRPARACQSIIFQRFNQGTRGFCCFYLHVPPFFSRFSDFLFFSIVLYCFCFFVLELFRIFFGNSCGTFLF